MFQVKGKDMNSTNLRVLGISGSLRKASFNSGLLRAAQEVTPDGMEVSIFDIRDIPFTTATSNQRETQRLLWR
jgi:chromate reductase